jgi:hypothetical protein
MCSVVTSPLLPARGIKQVTVDSYLVSKQEGQQTWGLNKMGYVKCMPSMHLAMAADVRPGGSHILSLTPEPGIESQIESIHARNPASIRCDVPPQDQANQRSILAGLHASETGTQLDQQGAGVVGTLLSTLQ